VSRRAAVYCRISRDRAGAGLGVDRQEKACRELAGRLGWEVAAVLVDNDLTASTGRRRPGYEDLLGMIESGTVTAVVAWHTDRLHRRPVELERFVDLCDRKKVAVQTVQSGPVDLSTPAGRLNARVAGAVARHEVDQISARARAQKEQAAERGAYRGGRRPFGYLADGVTVVPKEAEAVRQAAADLLAGTSLRAIARRWAVEGRTTSTGVAFTPHAIGRLLKRARNAGLVEHAGEIVGEASWEPLLPRDTWQAVHAVLTDPSRLRGPGTARRWLLSGIAKCGICQRTLNASATGNSRRRWPVYVCLHGKHVTRAAKTLDALVTDLVVGRLGKDDAIDLIATTTVDVQALREEALALRARLDELSRLFAAGDIDAMQLREGSAELRRRLDEAEGQLADAAAGSAIEGLVGVDDVRAAWDALDISRQQAVVATLLDVKVMPATKKGRPAGWKAGDPYFDAESVRIEWKS
jgi:DNA invertase Pin-like site-specific DNA recombinase